MRNFNLKNPKLVKTTYQGKESVYFVADAVNPDDWFDTLGAVNIFDDQYNHAYLQEIKKYFSKENGGTGDVDTDIPEGLLAFKNASKMEVPFVEPMVLVYDKDEDGHKAGEPRLNRNGGYYVKTSVMVTVKKPIGAKDDDAQWIPGWSPSQRRDQIMNRFYRPLRDFQQNVSTVEEAPLPE